MQTGTVEANLVTLNAEYQLPFLADLIERKQMGRERERVGHDLGLYDSEFGRLTAELKGVFETTHLPARVPPHVEPALSELLLKLRH